jgi:acetate kinase
VRKALLVINSGSSSVKFTLFARDAELSVLASGMVAGIGTAPVFTPKGAASKSLQAGATHRDALDEILAFVDAAGEEITCAVHRVVHGGTKFLGPVVVTDDVLEGIKSLIPLAPLHQPHNVTAIEMLRRMKPDLLQIADFDTAFHARHDPLFTRYAISQGLHDSGIRRYGFHGLSYEWIARTLKETRPDLAAGRVVVAHLGNGASLCALKNGESLDTTMGMTALEGLPMGTRSGSIDPGAVLYLVREFGVEKAERILYSESGLKGLSGISSDAKELSESADSRAKFALDYFALKTAQHIAVMATSLGGMDALVFTGGIGEHAENIRAAILERLSFLPKFETLIIPANEERLMAIHAVGVTT